MKAVDTSKVNTILRLFKKLTHSDQMLVAEKIGEQTFEERWKKLDEELPNVEYSEDEIFQEVRAVRYGKMKD